MAGTGGTPGKGDASSVTGTNALPVARAAKSPSTFHRLDLQPPRDDVHGAWSWRQQLLRAACSPELWVREAQTNARQRCTLYC